MKSHHIELISDIEPLGLMKEDFEYPYSMWVSKVDNVLEREAIFKCKDVTPSEIFGYEFASMLNMPVLEFKGVWFEGKPNHDALETLSVNPMGILIEKIVGLKKMNLGMLAQHDSELAAKYLILQLFDRFEPLSIFKVMKQIVILDLEYIGPRMLVGDSGETIEDNAREYIYETDDQWRQILKLAVRHRVLNELVVAFKDAGKIINSSFGSEFILEGHPHSEKMSGTFVDAMIARYSMCAENMG